METHRTNGILLQGLYEEWLNTLVLYKQQINDLELVIKQNTDGSDLSTRYYLQELFDDLEHAKMQMDALSEEIFAKHDKVEAANEQEQNVVPLYQLIENNRLRARVIKAEQSVFYLKYEVNKLLSLAS